MRKILLILGTIILLIAGYYFFSNQTENIVSDTANSPTKNLTIGEKEVKVDIADTIEERSKGLSGKEILETDTGLLFIFDEPGKYGFWMKDMNFSIDIVWIDSERRILSCEENVTPESYPKIYYPKEPILYVLEVRVGSCREWGLSSGEIVSWEE